MKYGLILSLLLTLGDPLCLATPAQKSAPPEEYPGTLPWARAVEQARTEAAQARTADEIRDAYGRLSLLYRDCAGCRRQMVEYLRHRLKQHQEDETAIRQVLEVALADDAVSLAALKLEMGRAEEAMRTATGALSQAYFQDDRLTLLDLIGDAHWMLGHARRSRSIARTLLDETPVSSDYCEKALKWLAWLGEAPLPVEAFINPRDFNEKFEHVRRLERERGDDAYVSCSFNHYLLQLDRIREGSKQVQVTLPTEVESLFPEGIDAALQDLARRTSDPRARAAILLGVARRVRVRNAPVALALIREAKAAGSEKAIQVGALKMELSALNVDEKREEAERLALGLKRKYHEYEASCSGCVSYWYALTNPWPEYSSRVESWRQECGSVMEHCPMERWREILYYFPPQNTHAVEVYENLLSSSPDQMAPGLMLRLSSALRATDSEHSWRLEHTAIHHPEFPGLGGTEYGGAEERAEAAGDFETALYLDLLAGRPMGFGVDVVGGDRSAEVIPDFRRAYYEVQLGIGSKERWRDLIGMLQKSPQEPSWRGLHTDYFLDRLIKAARIVGEESATLDWLRTLRDQYMEAINKAHDTASDHQDEASLRKIESNISRVIQEMETGTRYQSEPQMLTPPSSPPPRWRP